MEFLTSTQGHPAWTDPDRDGPGWLIAELTPAEDGSGTLIEARGEVDDPTRRAIQDTMARISGGRSDAQGSARGGLTVVGGEGLEPPTSSV
jgi:hypothetical protein